MKNITSCNKLILFDIDGTLILVDHVADRAFRAMTKEVYGLECSFREISYSGKTDPQILEEVLLKHGFDRSVIWDNYDLAVDSYYEYFDYFAKNDSFRIVIHPGVISLLNTLRETKNIYWGLLTGNLEVTAWKKLELAGIDHYFSFGAFGSDSSVRSELVKIAVGRAEQKYGISFREKDIVIIGDSPHDIECGKPYGVTSIAVATGHHSLEELAQYCPDYVFNDLGDHEKVMEAIARS